MKIESILVNHIEVGLLFVKLLQKRFLAVGCLCTRPFPVVIAEVGEIEFVGFGLKDIPLRLQ